MNNSPSVLTKEQFFDLMRMYSKSKGTDYPMYGLKDMYAKYCNGFWAMAVQHAMEAYQDFVAVSVARNKVEALKRKPYRTVEDYRTEITRILKKGPMCADEIAQELECSSDNVRTVLKLKELADCFVKTKLDRSVMYSLRVKQGEAA